MHFSYRSLLIMYHISVLYDILISHITAYDWWLESIISNYESNLIFPRHFCKQCSLKFNCLYIIVNWGDFDNGGDFDRICHNANGLHEPAFFRQIRNVANGVRSHFWRVRQALRTCSSFQQKMSSMLLTRMTLSIVYRHHCQWTSANNFFVDYM